MFVWLFCFMLFCFNLFVLLPFVLHLISKAKAGVAYLLWHRISLWIHSSLKQNKNDHLYEILLQTDINHQSQLNHGK